MSDFITLECPSCGGPLRITGDIDHLACAHCGNEHVVRRSRSVVSLKPVEGLSQEDVSELAARRLKEEIRNLESEMYGVESELDRLFAIRPPAVWSIMMAWILTTCILLTIISLFTSFIFERAYSANALGRMGGNCLAVACLSLGVLALGLPLLPLVRSLRRRSQQSRRYNERYNEAQHRLSEARLLWMEKQDNCPNLREFLKDLDQ